MGQTTNRHPLKVERGLGVVLDGRFVSGFSIISNGALRCESTPSPMTVTQGGSQRAARGRRSRHP
jgi:hypothetical protein